MQPPPGLPDAHDRWIRLASVPPDIRTLLSHLPRGLTVAATLPHDPHATPLAARQLLKLALLTDCIGVTAVALGGETRLDFAHGERRCTLAGADLHVEVREAASRILRDILTHRELAGVLEEFAFESANLTTLQTITQMMLQSTDVDRALHAMLCGVTSGFGLGFNRAALFAFDEESGALRGWKGVGPGDEAAAQQIWEDIELHDLDIEALIAGYSQETFDSRYEAFVRSVTLHPGDNDEVTQALAASGPLVFTTAHPGNEGLRRLGVAREFVLAAIRPHGGVLGLFVLDNRYTGAAITQEKLSSFRFFIDQTALVWENLQLLERVAKLARFDGLTGVLTRREFEVRLEAEVSRASRSQQSCALLLLDVDHFKEVNDVRGHQAGDEVLREVGALLRHTLRGHDLAGRFGGDEFVVFLPATSKEQMAVTAARLGERASAGGCSLSIGGAAWPADCSDPVALLGVADTNLYRAKRAGRCRAAFSGAEPAPFAQKS